MNGKQIVTNFSGRFIIYQGEVRIEMDALAGRGGAQSHLSGPHQTMCPQAVTQVSLSVLYCTRPVPLLKSPPQPSLTQAAHTEYSRPGAQTSNLRLALTDEIF